MSEEIAAGEELVRRFRAERPLKAAFWLKAGDEPYRYLYLAPADVGHADVGDVYGDVLRMAGPIESPFFDRFRIKLVGGDHPLAEAAAAIRRDFPRPGGNRLGGQMFGGQFADDVYIYPEPQPAAAT